MRADEQGARKDRAGVANVHGKGARAGPGGQGQGAREEGRGVAKASVVARRWEVACKRGQHVSKGGCAKVRT